ncbi:MAG: helix-turn-helix domain-containing protein [Thermoleophilaceae bacterium]
MGRPRIFFGNQSRAGAPPNWVRPYYTEWSGVIGGRIRRLRQSRGLTLVQVAGQMTRPDGGRYSHGYLSRLERGWASAPLHFYLSLADVLKIEPGRLLGPDDCQVEASEAELSLLACLREIGLAPHQALARLLGPEHAGVPTDLARLPAGTSIVSRHPWPRRSS